MSEVVKLNIKPVVVNPVVDACSDTEYVFVLHDGEDEPLDLSDYTAKMQIRPYPGAKKLYDELTTENGRLEIVESGVRIRFPAHTTGQYSYDRAVYDLYIMSSGGLQYRIAQGEVEVSRGVTL